MSEYTQFMATGIAGDVQECKTSWFEGFVKTPLKNTLVSLLHHYPEPVAKRLTKKNSLTWLTLRDKYLGYEKNPIIWKMAKLFFDLIISEYEHDPPYEERIDCIVEMIVIAYMAGEFATRGMPAKRSWDEPFEGDYHQEKIKLEQKLIDAMKQGDRIEAGLLKKRLEALTQ